MPISSLFWQKTAAKWTADTRSQLTHSNLFSDEAVVALSSLPLSPLAVSHPSVSSLHWQKQVIVLCISRSRPTQASEQSCQDLADYVAGYISRICSCTIDLKVPS